MAQRLNLTRPELKRQRDLLRRFSHYLPMLKLKLQILQVALQKTEAQFLKIQDELSLLEARFKTYSTIIRECSGVNLAAAVKPSEIRKGYENIGGVEVPYFEQVIFDPLEYDLFETPAWVDGAIRDLREFSALHATEVVLHQRYDILKKELARALQRVNLFEKVKIPAAQEVIRRIRIQLGDEMAAAVARAKAAKAKITQRVDYD